MSADSREDSDGLVSLLAGIGVGVLLGGMLALLLAPQSGSQTRAQIKESADDALVRLRHSMEELRVKVEEVATNTREAIAAKRTGSAEALPEGSAAVSEEGAQPA